VISTILLSLLIAYTLYAMVIKLFGGPMAAIGNQISDLVLYAVWVGYGIKHLFW
jgi:hypothetical protein